MSSNLRANFKFRRQIISGSVKSPSRCPHPDVPHLHKVGDACKRAGEISRNVKARRSAEPQVLESMRLQARREASQPRSNLSRLRSFRHPAVSKEVVRRTEAPRACSGIVADRLRNRPSCQRLHAQDVDRPWIDVGELL